MRTRRHFGKTSRLGAGLVIVLVVTCIALLLGVFIGGCEDDSEEEPVGTSVIQGNVELFEGNGAHYFPAGKQNLWASIVSVISEGLVPSAYAGQAGITVYLLRDGSVFRNTMTGDDGTFVFSELPAGDYQFRFEYQGQEVPYRAESGQIASITVENNQVVDISGIKISGGRVNIGKIRVVQPDQSGENAEDGKQDTAPDGDQQDSTPQTGTSQASTIWYSGIRNLFPWGYPNSLLDVNNDGKTDFKFPATPDDGYFAPQSGNAAVGPLSAGSLIDAEHPSSGWYGSREKMVSWMGSDGNAEPAYSETWAFGPWAGVINGYMGLAVSIDGAVHYGWARISIPSDNFDNTLHDWAYETRPGVGIKAGQTE